MNRRVKRTLATVRAMLGSRALTYHQLLEQQIFPECRSLLDVGCGGDSPIQVFSNRLEVAVGVDLHRPSLDVARARRTHTAYEELDLLNIRERFGPRSFDAVMALDVIEHFERSEGLLLLELMEQVARKRVVIFTPNGFLRQEAFDRNPWQLHRSGWTVGDFEKRGYRVRGVNGLRFLRTQFAQHRVRPDALGDLLSRATQVVAFDHPSIAFQLLAVRDLAAPRSAA